MSLKWLRELVRAVRKAPFLIARAAKETQRFRGGMLPVVDGVRFKADRNAERGAADVAADVAGLVAADVAGLVAGTP